MRQESKKWCATRWRRCDYYFLLVLLSFIFYQLPAGLLCLWKVYFTRATKTEIVQLLIV